jgi:hypothetical protein
MAARDAAAKPFPREERTPPVTKMYFTFFLFKVIGYTIKKGDPLKEAAMVSVVVTFFRTTLIPITTSLSFRALSSKGLSS